MPAAFINHCSWTKSRGANRQLRGVIHRQVEHPLASRRLASKPHPAAFQAGRPLISRVVEATLAEQLRSARFELVFIACAEEVCKTWKPPEYPTPTRPWTDAATDHAPRGQSILHVGQACEWTRENVSRGRFWCFRNDFGISAGHVSALSPSLAKHPGKSWPASRLSLGDTIIPLSNLHPKLPVVILSTYCSYPLLGPADADWALRKPLAPLRALVRRQLTLRTNFFRSRAEKRKKKERKAVDEARRKAQDETKRVGSCVSVASTKWPDGGDETWERKAGRLRVRQFDLGACVVGRRRMEDDAPRQSFFDRSATQEPI